ncbi:MAG TPA: 2-hydroxyacyl-CoA dehydratase family protein [Deltaproteobacteria bacterium]|nr:2-hydroxyacyl-CoA dehydratase family protein [Deltaproteobacteria bacterium]HPR54536.1 2-hydroxyacyl-CoA dehydratase family protein [Deltaproteobacteria bacterium]HXK47384.1 2-hydroxyacyl-CoA dehydratase family protein [Deltaproteobacteria bacterium]
MKRETREYPFDWMMWSILENASRSTDGSRKEYDALCSLVPHFADVLDTFVKHGEPGRRFLRLIADYTGMCATAHERGRKAALTTFCMATPVLYAFDVVPVMLEVMTVLGTVVLKRGTGEYLDYCCEVGFTETSCSAQRGSLGAFLSGLAVRPDFIICDTPGICDTNANSFSFASAFLDVPFFQLNYPPTITGERTSRYQRQDFRSMLRFIEEQTGATLNEDRLKEILAELRRQDMLATELIDLMRLRPSPVPGIYDLLLYGGRFMMSGQKPYTDLLESMLRVARENAAAGISGTSSTKERARGLFCYIDHYTTDARFWAWMDENDISHLGSILFTFWHDDAPYASDRQDEAYHLDLSGMDSMIDSLCAQMSRMPMIKQIRGPYDAPGMWLDDLMGAARLLKPDFVAYIGSMGCRNSWGMNKLLARDLEHRGVPTIILFADAFDDRVASWEAITDRMSEFLKLRRIAQ